MATRGGGVYFPVDAGFCDTQAARQVTRRFGPAGFCAYVRLLCMMLREDGGRLSVALDDDWADVADQLGMGDDEARELVAVLAHYGAVVLDDGTLWSPLVSASVAAREKKREAAIKGNEKRWGKRDGDASHSESHSESQCD